MCSASDARSQSHYDGSSAPVSRVATVTMSTQLQRVPSTASIPESSRSRRKRRLRARELDDADEPKARRSISVRPRLAGGRGLTCGRVQIRKLFLLDPISHTSRVKVLAARLYL